MTAPTPLLTAQELSDYLQVPVVTLKYWRTARSGPPFTKIGSLVRYRLADVDRWITQRTEATDGAPVLSKARGASPVASRGGTGRSSTRGTALGSRPRAARSTLPGGDAA